MVTLTFTFISHQPSVATTLCHVLTLEPCSTLDAVAEALNRRHGFEVATANGDSLIVYSGGIATIIRERCGSLIASLACEVD